ncbi:MAG: L-lactate dehydrogenase [Firmicutes bacterium]|nr:L-lactate dehydrogenase [Bacillota bacterium]
MIAIIGAGFVGATTAYALMLSGSAQEIVLIDINQKKAQGEAMDLLHGSPFVKPLRVFAGEMADCRQAKLIIFTAGAKQKPGQSRLDLLRQNSEIVAETVAKITALQRNPLILMVTNPVDVLSYVAWQASGLEASRIIGSGTVLDSARFRQLIASHCGVASRHVHGYIIGEHGDSEVALWSTVTIGGSRLQAMCPRCGGNCRPGWKEEVEQKVKRAAYDIIERKGATYYAVALAVRAIVEAITRDEKAVLTVSTLVQNQIPGLDKVYLSLPCIVGSKGVEKILPLELDEREKEQLIHSGKILKGQIEKTAPVLFT